MSEKLQVDFSYRQILKIALPIGLALLVPQFNFIINNIFLGHLSEEALATASITGVYYLIFAGIGFGLNNGLQSLISRRAGENRPEEIGKIFNQGVFVSLAIASFGILVTWFIAPLIFKSTIHSEQVLIDVIRFLRIRIFGLLFLYIYQMRNALLVGINQSRLLVIGTFAEAVANVVFDYALIFGHFGLPKMGFDGAAVASVIAEFIGMFVIFLVIRSRGISQKFSLFQKFTIDKHYLKLIVTISGPLAFQHAISIISWFFFYILVEHHGQTSLAVSNTMRNIFGFFGSFIWAFSSTTNSMVSNIIGQGKKEEVVGLITRIMKLSCSVAVIVFLFLNIFPAAFLSIYGQNEQFISLGIPALRVVAVAMLFMSVGTIWLNAVTGTGNGRITFIIELIAISLYCIYVYLVLELNRLSIVWGWMSELIYWSVLFTLSYWYIRSKRWHATVI
ncbi:MATE family efflux transporter [Flavisolibacter ginsengisoli]|jgi:putative MATE family efflux protein|uniref:Multidrug-efflux transporter n=1 Tax=Flavisolibacter ginsengisoli DSM 18119 TaxID=1121884 RepID=A0A1M4YSH3_9BACT|nr:MATE family efflux transporter [Flavisolibacter ginsengisoli]SHF08725.1 putative efflux protein, MATE family [Flavisolibacter ginsengisoli DSM 18119]